MSFISYKTANVTAGNRSDAERLGVEGIQMECDTMNFKLSFNELSNPNSTYLQHTLSIITFLSKYITYSSGGSIFHLSYHFRVSCSHWLSSLCKDFIPIFFYI